MQTERNNITKKDQVAIMHLPLLESNPDIMFDTKEDFEIDQCEMTLISETHWDREWSGNYQEFRYRLIEAWDHLLHLLDTKPDFLNFMFDGQTIVVEDYLQIRPEMQNKVIVYIKNHRITVGPFYQLPDTFLISGEAHIRNLLAGMKFGKDYNVPIQKVGYMPDSFGHIAQMPQILRGFDINNYVFTRGLGDEASLVGTEFWWQSPAGNKVFTQYMMLGYGNCSELLKNKPLDQVYGDAKNHILQMRDKLIKRARVNRVLLMNGMDNLHPEDLIPEFIDRFNKEGIGKIVHRTLEEHIILVQNDLSSIEIPILEGELSLGREHLILRDTCSTRIYLKQKNTLIENLYEKWADPMNALAWIAAGGKDENPQYLWYGWKKLMECHPHDSICGTSIDEVHAEMVNRFRTAKEIASIQICRACGELLKPY